MFRVVHGEILAAALAGEQRTPPATARTQRAVPRSGRARSWASLRLTADEPVPGTDPGRLGCSSTPAAGRLVSSTTGHGLTAAQAVCAPMVDLLDVDDAGRERSQFRPTANGPVR
jgi:hypothetical protein